MKTYKLRVMHPGGTTIVETIKANGYTASSTGCYEFYVYEEEGHSRYFKTISSYPIMFTIIEKIEND